MLRSLVVLTVGWILACSEASAGPAGKTTISWHGQSFFIIKSSKGSTVAIDPHAILEYGRFLGLKADAVLFSHLHNDHTQIGVFENSKDLKVLPGLSGKGLGTSWNRVDEKIKDIHIRNVASYHDNQEGMRFGKNSIFILDVDGWKIVHLGDLGHPLTDAQLKQIGPVDVLMIPVGGVYTLNGSEAKKVVEQIKPKEYILPMHYGTARYQDLLPLDEFLDENPAPALALSKDDKLIVNKNKKEWPKFYSTQVTKTDNRLILDRDPNRPRPVLVPLHWWPQADRKKTGEKDKDKKDGK